MKQNRKRELIIIGVFILMPVIVVAAEFQLHWFEHMIGSYLESTNDQRDRLEKFVEQDARSFEASKMLENLLTRKETGEDPEPEETRISSGVVRLQKNHRMIMTAKQFKEVHQKLVQIGKSIPQANLASGMAWSKSWERTILVRPGWIQAGVLYFVDDQNTILTQAPLSAELYELLDVFAMESPEESPFGQPELRIYGPRTFFFTLAGLPSTIRDQVIEPRQFLSLEATARRIGLTGVKGNRAELHIETSIQDHIGVTSIMIPGLIHKELIAALEKEVR
ncbi:MAG: hypothetical protein VYA69_12615 [Gemmatimonadota bacterium]|nr:hypothetical protein [Gemmatimonadota bacterium]